MKSRSDERTLHRNAAGGDGISLILSPSSSPSLTINEDGVVIPQEEPSTQQQLISSLRSQRLSDTYPLRSQLAVQTKPAMTRIYQSIISNLFIDPIVTFLFPRVLDNRLQNLPIINLFFKPTTQVQLLCAWTCEEGHICKHTHGHTGKHECIFGHVEGEPIAKCGKICDCRFCEAPCVLKPNHSGTHACHFRHALRDIPTNRREQEAFRDEKAIGGYMSELAFISGEDMKYSHIPTTLNDEDEHWWSEK
ncbi:hypothetical protein C9374_001263 [Naegleria lovaniensis]|uniref:Uncharacterized protein n=1 Tax=Naegleria lovaniensis TaxID=51637 RepID=A0AA88KN63_NAELO|nr:uncharacterized protein C9374_001263 [Naegleria lovaniensis]KAG2387669.1 hypothetical protein C9374_001263 [Naegleria lovaniensis]